MPLEDNVIIRFTVQQQQLQNALSQISNQLSNIGRQAPQLGRATQGMAQVGRQAQANTRVFNAHNRSVGKAGGMLQDLQSQTGAFTSSFRKAAMSIQTGTGWLDKFAIQADRASMMMWKFSMSAVSLNQLAATTGAVALGFGMVTKKMVDSFSMVDRIKRQFVSIYQSAEIGGKMVDQLVTDAVKIRYTVEQVLEAGRLLAIEGFNPQDLIYDMSDLAAGVNQEGISVVNATRAFVDATNGQFRRLKETFQITREDAMAFAPDAFQGPNNQISNQAKATDAIIRAIRSKYRGMNEATMQTIGGMLSNVDDAMVKSMAKMGEAIEGTVVGWLTVIMGTFEKIEAFADTGLGKAVANTLLWGTAIMGAVTALALLGAGMITILGLFAAYRVFTQTRGEGVRDIISAELKLMAVQQEIAKFEAMRSAQDIEGLQLKLALSKAVFAEEQKRLQLMGVPLPGGKSNPVNDASLESLTAARMKAQAQVDVIAKPRELLGLNDNLKTTQDEIAAIERTSLGVQSERYAVLKAQEQTMLRQQALMQAEIADAKAIAGGGVGGNTERVIAQQARADADALAAKAAVEETKATTLQAEADQLSANVTALRTQQTEMAAIATDLETAAVEANTAATLANAEAKATAFKFTEKQKMVSSLATGRDVELFDIDTRIKEQQLERMRGNTRDIMREGSADDLAEHSLRMERLAAEIEQRHEKLPELQSQAAIRQGSEQELGQLEEEARLRREAADAAAIRRRETAAAARENSTGLRNVNRELAQQERQLERTTRALNKQQEVAGSLQAQAAAAAGSATAAEADSGIVTSSSPVPLTPERIKELQDSIHYIAKERGDELNTDMLASNHDWQLGTVFDAHGIDKGNDLQRLTDLLNNGIDPQRGLHTTAFNNVPELAGGLGSGMGTSGTAYKTGGFTIMGGAGKKLSDGIKNVIVNDAWYGAMEDLQKAFPGVNFIRADDLQQGLQGAIQSQGFGTDAIIKTARSRAELINRQDVKVDELLSLPQVRSLQGTDIEKVSQAFDMREADEEIGGIIDQFNDLIEQSDVMSDLWGQITGQTVLAGAAEEDLLSLQSALTVGQERELALQGQINDVSFIDKDIARQNLATQQAINVELARRVKIREMDVAAARATAVADAAGMGGAARFGRGMMAGAGVVFGPILGLVEGVANIVAGPFIALGQAIGAANLGFVGIAGVVTGFAAALASLIGVAYLVSSTLKYDAQSLRSFRDELDDATDKLKGWADLLNPNPTQTSGIERANAGRTAMGKIGEMGSFGEFQGWASIPAEFLKRALAPGYGLRAAFDNSPIPGMDRNKFRIGDRLLKSQDGNLGQSQEILADMIRAAQASGNVPKALEGMTPEMAKGMDAAAIKEIIVTEDERRQLAADLDSYYRSMNKQIEKQGFALDRQAIQWMKARIASGELTEEEKERYKTMLASATPAKDLNKHLKDSFKSAEQMIPDLRDIEDAINEGVAAGKTDLEIQNEIKADRDAAAQKLKEMEASLQAQRDMGFQISTEDERRVKQLHEQVDLVNRQVDLYGTIKQLLADIKAQGTVSASGMGNTGAIFGDDIAAGEWAKAQAEKDPKKRQAAIENAFKAARASREDKAKQTLDLYAPGPTASPAEKAEYERLKAQVERERMSGVEADYQKAMTAGNLTPEQRARAEMQIAAERRQSNNAIKGYNKSARDIEFDDQIKQMEARRRGAAVAGASPQQLAQLDMNILRIRMQQAKVNNDITEQMNLQVQAAEIMRGLQDAALGTEEAKLSYMQTQADQGLISQDAVDAEKRQLAAMYQNRARQAAAGSQEYYENMNKALSLLGDDTEEKWSGIIGKILGAPQSLIDSVVSSGWITQGFGGMENQFGMGRGMQAEIASQSRREVVVRVSWENLDAVSRKVEAVLPQAMNAFGREFANGMSAA